MPKYMIFIFLCLFTTITASPEIDLTPNLLMGRFNPHKSTGFQEIPTDYASHKGHFLQKDTLKAFVAMANAARKEGIVLKVVSATRNFQAQKAIWESKWTGRRLVEGKNLAKSIQNPITRAKEILKFSSMPGTSRHHWGTDLDINSVSPAYFNRPQGKKIYSWLSTHARKFGFCQPYTPKNGSRTTGYEMEAWHWSYLPLAKPYLQSYLHKINYTNLKGFKGFETAQSIQVIENYVAGINPECK